VPYSFDTGDVEALSSQRAGLAEAETLARIVHALRVKRQNPACRWFPRHESTMLWKWRAEGNVNAVALAVRNVFPPLADVPPAVLTWARRTCGGLTPAEMDYLAAMFVCVAHPWRKCDVGERWAFSHALDVSLHHPREEERSLVSSYEAGDWDGLRSLIEDGEDSRGQRRQAVFAGVRINDKAPASLLSAARKQAKDRRAQGQGKPSSAKVAVLLGIHRYQATRLWAGEDGRKGIAQKLGPRQWDLFNLLGMETRGELPRLLKKYAPAEPKRKHGAMTHVVRDVKASPAAFAEVASVLGMKTEDLPQTESALKQFLQRRVEAAQELQRKASAQSGKGHASLAREDGEEMHGAAG